MPQTVCRHDEYVLSGNIVNVADDKGDLIGRCCEVKVRCKQCNLPFEFSGGPFENGYQKDKITADADQTTIRLPIKPVE